ncbi:MAG: glycosyltransferase family 2 protein [Candidatus Bathyarchaeota archaeon]|nr:glycosyltransferase family 2 protein [Candidatus Bathyarchaeota archaeon]
MYSRSNFKFPRVSIIVVNYNGKPFLKKCFSSLMKSIYPEDFEVIMVDNASKDGSVEFVSRFYPSVKIEKSSTNLGYAAGCNRGAKLAKYEYMVFMNNDIEVTRKWLLPLVQICSDPEVAICGGKILLNRPRNQLYSAGGVLNLFSIPVDRGFFEEDRGSFDRLENVAYVSGAALMVDRYIFEKLGGFDDDFFAFCEEVDLCLRSWISGYRVVFVPSSIVYHIFGGSFGKPSAFRNFFGVRNMLFTMIKIFELKNLMWLLPINLAFRFFEVFILTLLGKRDYLFYFKASVISVLLGLGSFIEKREKVQKSRLIGDFVILKFFRSLKWLKYLFKKAIFQSVL